MGWPALYGAPATHPGTLIGMARAHRPAFKGCCAMCASGKGKVRGQGRAEREPARELRLRGKRRRIGRRDIPPDQWEQT